METGLVGIHEKMCFVKQQNHLRIDDEADPRNSDEENAGNIHLEILNWKIYIYTWKY